MRSQCRRCCTRSAGCRWCSGPSAPRPRRAPSGSWSSTRRPAPCAGSCPRRSSSPSRSAPTGPAAPSRPRSRRWATRLPRRRSRCWCSAATCRSSAPRRSRELLDAHRDGGAAATMATTVLEDPSGYGRVVRDADGAVERVVETKTPGRLDAGRARDPRGQHGHLRVRRPARCARRCRGSAPTTPRASCTCRRCSSCCAPTGPASPATPIDDPRLVLGVNDRAALAEVACASPSRRSTSATCWPASRSSTPPRP